MREHFLLSRVLMQFDTTSEDVHGELSSATVTPDGSLWVGSDELLSIERLSPLEEPYVFGNQHSFHIGDFVNLFNLEGEIDIEGMDYSNGYLWLTGSHSIKRKKTKGKKAHKDIERLSTIKPELNRYVMARIPIVNGEPMRECSVPGNPDVILRAANVQQIGEENILIRELQDDAHIAPFTQIPNKENGLDIEGLAVHGDRVFLGLRGPVLRGWAIILEIEVEETRPGMLTFKQIGAEDRHYRKHFFDLNGLGIRELCLQGEHMLILAGPTMDLEGAMEVFRLKNVLELDEDSISQQDDDKLELLFDLPFTIGSDHAEGLAFFPCLGQPDSLLVVYDSPDPVRQIAPNKVFADVFLLR
jgi:hypothetical protein